MNSEQKFIEGYRLMMEACQEQGWGDPFSYARSKEILLAITLGHKISKTLSGADAFDEDGECEYKSTTSKTINATYNGISVQETWEEQINYLTNKKIGKYKNHYVARFQGSKIMEVWWLDGSDVLEIAIAKLRSKFKKTLKNKDPRLGLTLNKKEIEEIGVRII